MVDSKGSVTKKILILGLDNSGKTSIVLNLMGKTNLLNYLDLGPTTGPNIINYEIENSKFNIWDLGGQKAFRDEYLKNFEDYLKGVEKIIYVIDVQDPDRYSISLEYLRTVINKLEHIKKIIDFTVFIHKMDPDLDEINPHITQDILKQLIKETKEVFPDDFFYEIYTSTIYTVFDKSFVS